MTLRVNEKQRCTVARILRGGMIHRQGKHATAVTGLLVTFDQMNVVFIDLGCIIICIFI